MPIVPTNSSTTILVADAVFTGEWIAVDRNVASIMVTGEASHTGTLFGEFTTTAVDAEVIVPLLTTVSIKPV